MKILNTMLGRQAIAAALVLSLAIPMSVGAFAEEPAAAAAADDTVVAGYLPPQDESVMLQGEIALHSGDVAVGETDPAYGGYGAPEGDPIQGDIMLISADEAKTTDAGLCRHLPHHHSGHEDPDGSGRVHAGAHHGEGFHHPEPFPAVRGPDRHPAGGAAAAGRQRFPDGRPALPPRPHRGPLSGVCSPFLKLNRNTAGALCRYDPVGRSCCVWEISENVKFYCAFCLRSCAFFQARNTLILVTMLSG